VQVAALGHFAQEGQQQWRLFADGVEVAGRFLLGGLRRGECGEKDEQRGQTKETKGAAGDRVQEAASGSWKCIVVREARGGKAGLFLKGNSPRSH